MDQWAIKSAGVTQAVTPLFKSPCVIVAQPHNLRVILQLSFSMSFRFHVVKKQTGAKTYEPRLASCVATGWTGKFLNLTIRRNEIKMQRVAVKHSKRQRQDWLTQQAHAAKSERAHQTKICRSQ